MRAVAFHVTVKHMKETLAIGERAGRDGEGDEIMFALETREFI